MAIPPEFTPPSFSRGRIVRLLKTSFVMRGVRHTRSQSTHSCRADVRKTNARPIFYEAIHDSKALRGTPRKVTDKALTRASPATGSPAKNTNFSKNSLKEEALTNRSRLLAVGC